MAHQPLTPLEAGTISELSVAPKATSPEALTLADVTIVREGREEEITGRDLAIFIGSAVAMLRDRYLDHDGCSLAIREVADTLDLLARSDGICERAGSACAGLGKRLHHLVDPCRRPPHGAAGVDTGEPRGALSHRAVGTGGGVMSAPAGIAPAPARHPLSSEEVATLQLQVGQMAALAAKVAEESGHLVSLGEEEIRRDYDGWDRQNKLVDAMHSCIVERLERIEATLGDFAMRTADRLGEKGGA